MSATLQEKKLCVLVSSLENNSSNMDLARIAPALNDFIDHCHSNGKFVWLGTIPFLTL